MAKSKQKSVASLISELIDKEIRESEKVIPSEGINLGDLLASVTLKESYKGLDSKSAMEQAIQKSSC